MREIQIVFTKSKKFLPIASWAIRLWTNKPYSHVARKLYVKDWAPAYYQASEGKVNYETESIFEKKHEIIKSYSLLVPDDQYNSMSQTCFEESGKKYGLLQNLGIVILDILGFFKIKVANPWKSGVNCSELIYVQVIAPLIGCQGHNPDTIKPHNIEEILESTSSDHFVIKNPPTKK